MRIGTKQQTTQSRKTASRKHEQRRKRLVIRLENIIRNIMTDHVFWRSPASGNPTSIVSYLYNPYNDAVRHILYHNPSYGKLPSYEYVRQFYKSYDMEKKIKQNIHWRY